MPSTAMARVSVPICSGIVHKPLTLYHEKQTAKWDICVKSSERYQRHIQPDRFTSLSCAAIPLNRVSYAGLYQVTVKQARRVGVNVFNRDGAGAQLRLWLKQILSDGDHW